MDNKNLFKTKDNFKKNIKTVCENAELTERLNEGMGKINDLFSEYFRLGLSKTSATDISETLEDMAEKELENVINNPNIKVGAMIFPRDVSDVNPNENYGIVAELFEFNKSVAFSGLELNATVCQGLMNDTSQYDIETIDSRYTLEEIIASNNDVEMIEAKRTTINAFQTFSNEIIENALLKWELDKENPENNCPFFVIAANIESLFKEKTYGGDYIIELATNEQGKDGFCNVIEVSNGEVRYCMSTDINDKLLDDIIATTDEWSKETGFAYNYGGDMSMVYKTDDMYDLNEEEVEL